MWACATYGRSAVGILILAAALLAARPAAAIEIRTLFVPFGGPPELGRSVATILALQFWQTLRKEPPRNPNKLYFGDGSVYWLGRRVALDSHQTAARMAQALDVTAQHVFWGQVHEFENTALITSYLTLPDYPDFRARRNEVWTIAPRPNDPAFTLSVDIPQRAYAFEPIVLPTEFVKKYSTPGALEMTAQKGGGARLGTLGVRFDRIESDGPYAKVYSNRKTGWVHLPQIGRHQPEIIDFIAGIMRIYRTDWQGAMELLGKVVRNERAPTAIRIDSYLYMIRAKSELGLPADAEAEAVLALASASRRAVQYVAMHYVARCYGRSPPGACGPGAAFLARVPEKYGALFAASDPWFANLKTLVQAR